MSEIPEDVMKAARKAFDELEEWPPHGTEVRYIIAEAILAERQRCAEVAREYEGRLCEYPNDEAERYYTSGADDASDSIASEILQGNALSAGTDTGE